jgi:hypothetical protein
MKFSRKWNASLEEKIFSEKTPLCKGRALLTQRTYGRQRDPWMETINERRTSDFNTIYLHVSSEAPPHKCAVLAHRLTKYEGVADKDNDNGNPEQGAMAGERCHYSNAPPHKIHKERREAHKEVAAA